MSRRECLQASQQLLYLFRSGSDCATSDKARAARKQDILWLCILCKVALMPITDHRYRRRRCHEHGQAKSFTKVEA